MWNMIWPLLLIVLSNCFYNICTKSVPEGANTFGTLTITYLVGAVLSAILFIVSVKPSGVASEIAKINWTAFVLGIAIVGLEAGYVFLYRAGWKVMNAIIESSIEIISICGKDNRKHEVLQSSHERLRLHHKAAQRHLYGCR